MEEVDLAESDLGVYLFEQNPTPMIIFSRDSLDIKRVNEAAIEQYGYSRREFTNLNVKQIRPREDIPKLMEALDKTAHQDYTDTYRHLTKEGELLYVQVQAKPLNLNSQNLQLAVLNDITEEVEAKVRSQQAESLARLGWWSYEIQKEQLVWSERLYDIMGVDETSFELTLDSFVELLHPEDRDKLDTIFSQIQQDDQSVDCILRALHPNNEVTYLKCRAQGVFDNDNEMVRIHGIAQDLTKQVQTQKELEKRSQAISSSMDGISILNEKGEFVYMNQAHADIYGYDSPDDLLGQTWEVLYRDDDRPYFEDNVLPKIEQEGWWRGEAVGKRKDGTTFPQEVSLSSTVDGGLICVIRDITMRKKHEEDTRQALKEKETLLEEIHHRVKNNLAVVTSILELQKFEPVESVEALIEDTQSRIQSIATIHEKLYQSETLSDIDVREYIEEFSEAVLDSFNSDQKNIIIRKDLQHYNLNTNRAVPLGLIVNELLSNAFKHGFSDMDEGAIQISLDVNEKEVALSVADNGKPLPDNFSMEESQSMGMSLIKTLTSQLEGTYHVNQQEWTTFEIRFPIVKADDN